MLYQIKGDGTNGLADLHFHIGSSAIIIPGQSLDELKRARHLLKVWIEHEGRYDNTRDVYVDMEEAVKVGEKLLEARAKRIEELEKELEEEKAAKAWVSQKLFYSKTNGRSKKALLKKAYARKKELESENFKLKNVAGSGTMNQMADQLKKWQEISKEKNILINKLEETVKELNKKLKGSVFEQKIAFFSPEMEIITLTVDEVVKKYQELLKEREPLLRIIMSGVPTSMTVNDLVRNFEEMHKAYNELLQKGRRFEPGGVQTESIIGRHGHSVGMAYVERDDYSRRCVVDLRDAKISDQEHVIKNLRDHIRDIERKNKLLLDENLGYKTRMQISLAELEREAKEWKEAYNDAEERHRKAKGGLDIKMKELDKARKDLEEAKKYKQSLVDRDYFDKYMEEAKDLISKLETKIEESQRAYTNERRERFKAINDFDALVGDLSGFVSRNEMYSSGYVLLREVKNLIPKTKE